VGNGFLLVLVAMFALFWFVLVRPQRTQQRRHADMLKALKIGDEIVTSGGIYGEVKSLDEERVRLEVDADVEIVVARRAIATIVPPDEAEDALLEEAEPADEASPEQPVGEDRAAR